MRRSAALAAPWPYLQAFWEPRGRRHFEIEERLPEDDLARLGDAIERAEAAGER